MSNTIQTCMMCKNRQLKSANEKGEVYCNIIKEYVELISPKCDEFKHLFNERWRDVEVIGNIYDTSELLEGGEAN